MDRLKVGKVLVVGLIQGGDVVLGPKIEKEEKGK